MALIVQKYGGTSVDSIASIQSVAAKVLQTKRQGNDVVVVVSAMDGETDRLIEMAVSVQERPSRRELDVLLTTAEQRTSALLAMAIQQLGASASSLTGSQIPITTDSNHTKARILNIESQRISEKLKLGEVVVVTGFQGLDMRGDITTLGRGGSDTTAVAIGAKLRADECQIYTDVDGVYTTDPRVCASACKLDKITFEEMLEMASQGSKVLQIRAVEFAGKYKVPLRVLSSFEEGSGTLIMIDDDLEESMEKPVVSGIAFNRDEAKISVIGISDEPGVAYGILKRVADANIEVDVIVQNVGRNDTNDLSFTVHRNELEAAVEAIRPYAKEVATDDKIVKVSLVGVGMRSHAGVAATMFKALADKKINIQLITTSEIKITVIIEERYLELAVRAIHSAFDMDEGPQYG